MGFTRLVHGFHRTTVGRRPLLIAAGFGHSRQPISLASSNYLASVATTGTNVSTTTTTTKSDFYSWTSHRRPFATAAAASATMKSKLGLGGNNWSRMEPAIYQSVIEKGLGNGITVFEAGQEGGDQALLDAYTVAQQQQQQKLDDGSKPVVTLTVRIGYRTILPTSHNNNNNNSDVATQQQQQQQHQDPMDFPGDVAVEQHPFMGPNRTMKPLEDEELNWKPPPSDEGEGKMIQILHNISEPYIQQQLRSSPLIQEYHQTQSSSSSSSNNNISGNMRVVALLHNPEAQIMSLANDQDINQVSMEDRQAFLKDRLVDAFCAMEKAVANNLISSYGVASNGLVLPSEHPLALSTATVLEAAKIAMDKSSSGDSSKCHFSVVQLPVNLMERTGLDIARDLHGKVLLDRENDQYQYLRDDPPLEIYAMRPLTCYPDRGTGTGHAFRLVDFLLPSGPKQQKDQVDKTNGDEDGSDIKTMTKDGEAQQVKEDRISDEDMTSKQWSHQMQGPPLVYSIALKNAMAHFDAEAILEEKMKRELTADERETLDGCKLLQSMLHDLDAGLADVRSVGAHEQYLYQQIIPLIYDTFEGYDEETADVLEMFFKAYSLAVRYSISRNTRTLLQKGGDDGKAYKYKDIPNDEKLQDYALKYLMNEDAISKVIVGATKPDHVVEMVKLCERMDAASAKDEKET